MHRPQGSLGLTYLYAPVRQLGLKVLREGSEASGEKSARWNRLESRQESKAGSSSR